MVFIVLEISKNFLFIKLLNPYNNSRIQDKI